MKRILVVTLFACCLAYSQGPAFEALSVKPAGPFVGGVSGRMNGGPGTADPTRITYTGVSLLDLLGRAYDVRRDQISGPSWLDGEVYKYSYTISATLPPNTSAEQLRVMLQSLLASRFHVTLHHETKDFPGYELVVANGGPKFKEAPPEPNPRRGFQFIMPGPNAPPNAEIPPLPDNSTGITRTPPTGQWGMFRSRYHMSMTDFIRGLGAMVNESGGVEMGKNIPRITDKTGLTGIYEFTLEFGGISILPSVGVPTEPADPGTGGQTIFEALEAQLGLKLQKVKGVPVDILVVDHAEKVPVEN